MGKSFNINRPLSANPNQAVTRVNGWVFHFGRYKRMEPLISSGQGRVIYSAADGIGFVHERANDNWRIPLDPSGRFLKVDGIPITCDGKGASINGEPGDKRAINFWHYALGLDGSLPNTRKITEDSVAFFANFLRAIEQGALFTEALRTRFNEDGIVPFVSGEETIPFPDMRTDRCRSSLVESEVILVPARINDNVVMLTFSASGGPVIEGFDFDPDHSLFFYINHEGQKVYFTTIQENDNNTLTASVLNYTLWFSDCQGRFDGEVIRTAIGKNGRLEGLQMHNALALRPLRFKPDKKHPTTIYAGKIPLEEQKAVGLTPKVKILKDMALGRPRYYVYFGRGDRSYYWLNQGMMEKFGLNQGDELEVEPENGLICALVRRRGRNITRVPFIMDWKWDRNRFVLDHTTSACLYADKMTGIRVIEQTESSPSISGGKLCVGGLKKIVIGYLPWKTTPTPLSALVVNGQEVVFFRDADQFTERDWLVAEAYVRAQTNDPTMQRKENEADLISKTADKLRFAGEADILEIQGLEEAYERYIDAFLLDPFNTGYLKSAMEVRNLIVLRKKHLERRPSYSEWALGSFSAANTLPESHARILSTFFASEEHNPTSAAYVLEVIAELAEASRNGTRSLFMDVFHSLPIAMDLNAAVGKRIMGAFHILLAEPRLEYIPRWVLSHPTPGKEALFRRRRGKIGILTDGTYEIDWSTIRKVEIASTTASGTNETITKKAPPKPRGLKPSKPTKKEPPKPKEPLKPEEKFSTIISPERLNQMVSRIENEADALSYHRLSGHPPEFTREKASNLLLRMGAIASQMKNFGLSAYDQAEIDCRLHSLRDQIAPFQSAIEITP